jgi:hypothetical protein
MLLREANVASVEELQKQRSEGFGAMTAGKIRAAAHCRFSLLPHEHLARLASGWYDASAQAMLSGNYVSIDTWIQTQTQRAAEQNFTLEDVLELLRICRKQAIQEEKWSEEVLIPVDEAIQDALRPVASAVGWTFAGEQTSAPESSAGPALSSAAEQAKPETAASEPSLESWLARPWEDRRGFDRNCLKLPIRVRAATTGNIDELTYSQNVSRGGLYFVTRSTSYKLQMGLIVTYPYWSEAGAINREYRAKVVRLDAMTDGGFGVAIRFTDSLGPRSRD